MENNDYQIIGTLKTTIKKIKSEIEWQRRYFGSSSPYLEGALYYLLRYQEEKENGKKAEKK